MSGRRRLTIRSRLTLWYTASICVLAAVMVVFLYASFAPALTQRTGQLLRTTAGTIAAELELEDGYLAFDDEVYLNPGIWYTVYDSQGEPALSNHPAGWLEELEIRFGDPYDVTFAGQKWLVHDSVVHEDGAQIAVLRVALQVDAYDEAISQLEALFLILLPVLAAAAAVIGLVIARRALRPVDIITATAREISRGDLSKRLRLPPSGDELGRLAETFDDMLASLEQAFLREKQFTSDASHELRTPLSVIMAHAQSVLDNPDATKDEYAAAMEAVQRKAREMQAMLSQLLLLSRGFGQTEYMEIVPVDLAAVAQDIVEEMTPTAAEKGVTLHCRPDTPVEVRGDLLLLTRMILNLVDNGIKYTGPGGWVRVEVALTDGLPLLRVCDNGAGIQPDKLAHVFKRFYRADPSHTGQGVGLGLSMVEWIAHLHGAQVEVESIYGEGSVFTVWWKDADAACK